MTSLNNWLQHIISLLGDSSITIKTKNSEQSLSLSKEGESLLSLGNDAGNILPTELSGPLLDALSSFGGAVLQLDKAYLMEASFVNKTGASGGTDTQTFSATIEWKSSEWELISNFLSLKNPKLNVHLTVSGQNTSKALYMSGNLTIAGIPLDASLVVPDMTLSAVISSGKGKGKTYPIGPLFSSFGFSSSIFNGINLNQFAFSANVKNHIFSLEVGLSSDLIFNINSSVHVTLGNVGLKLIHVGGNPSSNNITIYGTCAIGGQTYNLWLSKDSETGWSFFGEASFGTDGIAILGAVNAIITQFGLSNVTLPSSFTDSVKVSKISFEFHQETAGFDLEIDFTESMTIATLTGKKINPLVQPPAGSSPGTKPTQASCTTASITSAKTGEGRTTVLNFKIVAGVKLSDLLSMQGDLPSGLDPRLDEIDFSSTLYSSAGSKSSNYVFSTTFDNGSASTDKIVFAGEYSSVTSTADTETAIFGGSMYSPTGAAIELNDPDFPINMDITDLFTAKQSVTTNASKKTKSTTSYTIFGADVSAHADIDMSTIPIVGSFLHEAKFDFEALRIVFAKSSDSSKKSLSADKLKSINDFLSQVNISPLQTAQSTVDNNDSKSVDFPLGFSLQGNLVIGNGAKVIPLHSLMQQGGANTSKDTKQVNIGKSTDKPQASSNATPSAVGKKFGPVTVQDVNIGLEGSDLSLTFTGGIQLGPLFLEFIDLKFTSPVSDFDPNVDLSGFGIGLSKPPLSLEGIFLKSELTDPNYPTEKLTVYNGSIAVGYKQYQLVAMGSYAQLHGGETSMFIYGFLGAPLGGLPAILMITGAAAGFGYNRTFNLPLPENVQSFPLIQPVVNPGSPPDFNQMNQSFAPKLGAFWGAIGIRIEAFKMIEAFVLLDVKMDDELEIDIVGLATMKFPAPKKAGVKKANLANVIVGVVARIRPEKGLVTVNGAFQKGSYIYNPNAHLTGAFAMLSVLKEQHGGQYDTAPEGDFVFTMGGYAPTYSRPGYYPNVPRVELNWNVNSNLSVKGQFYFATTPNAMMAGGAISGLFHEGGTFSIMVSFNLGADFIIYWQPYHYSAHFYAGLHVTASVSLDLWLFTIHASVELDLNADLKIWGPSFSGHGTVSIHVLLTFSASVSFGDNEETLTPLSWQEFEDRLLPDKEDVLSINVGSGIVASHTTDDNNIVVDPKTLSIVCGSAIPIKRFLVIPVSGTPKTNFGIKPMGNTSQDFSESLFMVTLTRLNEKTGNYDSVINDFTNKAITKNMPASLWQEANNGGKVPLNSKEQVIQGLTSGVIIEAKGKPSTNSYSILVANEQVAKTTTTGYSASYTYSTGWSRGSVS